MTKRPEFIVIAGPNGAGKSRLCPFYIRSTSFDGDKLALKLREEHPEWPEHWITGSVASELEKRKNEALTSKQDFAFETNFSNEIVVEMIKEFKKAGFKISLCYFGLNSEDESVSRVILRSQTGGHNVTDEVIRFNFNEGLKNAKQYLHLFENLTFIDGSSNFGKIVAIHLAKSNIHEVIENPPLWFTEQFREAFDAL